MADIRDYAAFVRSRWDWHKFGYEDGFPGRCGFGDIDAALEFRNHALVVESKIWDGQGLRPPVQEGQVLLLRDEVNRGKTALIVYGCGICDDPWYIERLTRVGKRPFDLHNMPLDERRRALKCEINQAMGLAAPPAQWRGHRHS